MESNILGRVFFHAFVCTLCVFGQYWAAANLFPVLALAPLGAVLFGVLCMIFFLNFREIVYAWEEYKEL